MNDAKWRNLGGGGTKMNGRAATGSRGKCDHVKRICRQALRRFRTPENSNYYSGSNLRNAERAFVKACLLNGGRLLQVLDAAGRHQSVPGRIEMSADRYVTRL